MRSRARTVAKPTELHTFPYNMNCSVLEIFVICYINTGMEQTFFSKVFSRNSRVSVWKKGFMGFFKGFYQVFFQGFLKNYSKLLKAARRAAKNSGVFGNFWARPINQLMKRLINFQNASLFDIF